MNPIEPSENKIKELISLFDKKKFDQLLKLSNELIDEFPNSILIQNIQGVVHTELKNYKLAKNLFIKVVNLSPNYTDGHYNLANVYNKLDEKEKAIESYNKVIELDINYFKAHNNLGNIYRKKGLNKRAIECYLSTLEINSNYKVAYYNLAGVLQFYILDEENKNINKYLLHLLKEKIIVRPNSIAPNILNGLFLNTDLKNNLSLIKDKITNEDFNYVLENLQKNSLLMQFMKVCPIPDYYIEKNFVKIRKEILNQTYKLNIDKNHINFLISLSMQCFLNEYIYDKSKDEIQKINKINERIKNNLKENKKISDLDILCLSCYEPLTNFSWSNKIKFSDKLKEIFELHLNHNEIENQISKSIKSMSKVEDRISIKVREQYEENPYPRWRYSTRIPTTNFLSLLNYDIRPNKFISPNKFNNPKILIAGCGTGKQLNNILARENSNVVAFDLSLSSLAYAKRKARELNCKNINFIQGDLLDLKKLNKKFDIIESVGVLHHMNNPLKGWKSLTECIKDNGLMLIGLYSEKARENISEIRKKIRNLKIKTTSTDIINFRKKILETKNKHWESIKYSPDFYSTSGVRDLLFHVQEHRFTISKIKEYLDKLGLIFLGFEDQLVKEKFKEIYSNKIDLYNLDKWEEYEKYNPRIFAGMYQFWCQKVI